jgi:Domain of unknown function (DUF932)
VIDALNSVGFYPAQARQAVRARSALHARHLIRFRRRFETMALRDAVPEILFLNSHDGTSAYQLRVGLYRAVWPFAPTDWLCPLGLSKLPGGAPG